MERRAMHRLEVALPAQVRVGRDGGGCTCTVSDMSSRGAYLLAPELLLEAATGPHVAHVAHVAHVDVDLPHVGRVTLPATVVRVDANGGLALRWDAAAEARRPLADFLMRRLAER